MSMNLEFKEFNVNKPMTKSELARLLCVSVKTLGRWVRRDEAELGFTFGKGKILSKDKCIKILNTY